MNGRYLTLAGRIRRDFKDLETVVERSQQIWEQYQSSQNDSIFSKISENPPSTSLAIRWG